MRFDKFICSVRHLLVVVLLTCCTSGSGIAQPEGNSAQPTFRNSYKLGVSTISFGTGDMRGLNFSFEYNRRLARYVAFSPALQWGWGGRGYGGLIGARPGRQTKQSAALNLNMFFSPMAFNRSKVRLGVGPSIRYIQPTPGVIAVPGDRRLNQHWTLGYTVALEGEFRVFGPWLLGLGGAVQGYTNYERIWWLGLNGGYVF